MAVQHCSFAVVIGAVRAAACGDQLAHFLLVWTSVAVHPGLAFSSALQSVAAPQVKGCHLAWRDAVIRLLQ